MSGMPDAADTGNSSPEKPVHCSAKGQARSKETLQDHTERASSCYPALPMFNPAEAVAPIRPRPGTTMRTPINWNGSLQPTSTDNGTDRFPREHRCPFPAEALGSAPGSARDGAAWWRRWASQGDRRVVQKLPHTLSHLR